MLGNTERVTNADSERERCVCVCVCVCVCGGGVELRREGGRRKERD